MSYIESKIKTDLSGNVIFTGDGTTENPLSANADIPNIIGGQGIHKVGDELRLGINMDNLSTGIIDQFTRIQSVGNDKTQEFDINPDTGYWLTSRNNNNDSAQLLLLIEEDPLIHLQTSTSFESTEFTLRKDFLRIYSSSPSFAGITYSSDYSLNYNNRSLVDKEYVDTKIAESGGGGTILAENGIRKQGDTVKLGVELAPPYTNGLITEPTYLISGDAAGGIYTGITFSPENATPLIVGGKVGDVNTNIEFGDATGGGNGVRIQAEDDVLELASALDVYPNKINIGSSSGSTTFKGVEYYGNYSANYTDRSIPDVGWVKEYVENNSGEGQNPVTTGQGLYKTNDQINLGLSPNFDNIILEPIKLMSSDNVNLVQDFDILPAGGYILNARNVTANTSSALNLFTDNSGTQAIIYSGITGGDNSNISVTPQALTVGGNTTFKGIEYTQDYKSNYTNRSLVDKEYVDTEIANVGGGGGNNYNFLNGIHNEGVNIKLGVNPINPLEGIITENTQIIATDLTPKTQTITISPTGGLSLASRDTGKQSGITVTPEFINFVVDETGFANNTIEMYSEYSSVGAELIYSDNFEIDFANNDRAIPDVGWIKEYVTDNSGGGGNAVTISNGLEVKSDDSIGLGGTITDEFIEILDKNGYSIVDFQQDQDNEQELNLRTQFVTLQEENQTYVSNLELRCRDDYSRMRLTVSDENGDNVNLELHTDSGATINDTLFSKGLGDADDYSLNKTDYSYVTKKMLQEQYTFSNGLRQDSGQVKLGLDLTPPYTNGLLTEPIFLLFGNVAGGDTWGLSLNNDGQRSVQFQSAEASTGKASNILATIDQLSITKENGAEGSSITFNANNDIEVNSSALTFRGLSYSADYSDNYINRSLVDKEYVDNAVANSGGLTILTATATGPANPALQTGIEHSFDIALVGSEILDSVQVGLHPTVGSMALSVKAYVISPGTVRVSIYSTDASGSLSIPSAAYKITIIK